MSSDLEVGVANLATSLEEQAAALEREAVALRKLSEATRELGDDRVRAFLAPMLNGNGHQNGHADQIAIPVAEPTLEDGPRGREAVRLIVGERPGVWALSELRAEMQRRGWFTSNKGVDVAVTRLVRGGEARRVGTGRYEFSPAAPEDGDAP